MSVIRFETKPFKINSWTIILLPEDASKKLPSRGLAMVKGTINGFAFQTALEPDGNGSHWFRVSDSLAADTNVAEDETATLEIEATEEWTEPEVPADLQKALMTHSEAHDTWTKVTPMARWEWIRWIRATNRNETRARRIEVACSKLQSGMRRPCCFNTSMCTEPSVSKNGVLLVPAQTTA